MHDLMSLADETLHHIFTLISDTDRLTLFNVSCVNKRLHNIVSPLLVRHWPIHRWDCGQMAPGRFALHLLRHPHLRSHVKSLVFDPITTFGRDDHSKAVLDPEEMEELSAAARDGFPEMAESSNWCEELRQGGVSSIAALLLLLCTRLTSLDLLITDFYLEENEDFFVLQFVIQVANRLVLQSPQKPLQFHPLAELRSVVLRSWDTECAVQAQYAAPFFHLPKLTTLVGVRLGNHLDLPPLRSVGGDVPYDPDDIDAESFYDSDDYDGDDKELRLRHDRYLSLFPIGTSVVEDLILESINLTFTGLFTIVRACRKLRKLVLTTDCETMMIIDGNKNRLIRSILHHATSLEELAIRLYEHEVWEDEQPSNDPMNLEDCFKDLHRLKSLTIDIDFLYPIEHGTRGEMMLNRLPPSLEHLRFECQRSILADALPKHIGDIQKLLRECGPYGHLDRLQSLDLSWAIYDDPTLQGLDQLETIAEEKGVRLHLRSCKSANLFPYFVPEPDPPFPKP